MAPKLFICDQLARFHFKTTGIIRAHLFMAFISVLHKHNIQVFIIKVKETQFDRVLYLKNQHLKNIKLQNLTQTVLPFLGFENSSLQELH